LRVDIDKLTDKDKENIKSGEIAPRTFIPQKYKGIESKPSTSFKNQVMKKFREQVEDQIENLQGLLEVVEATEPTAEN
jgi:hypothetical protein